MIADSQLMVKKVSELFEERIVGLMPSEEDGTEGSTASEGTSPSPTSPILSDSIPIQLSLRLSHLSLHSSPRCPPRLS